MSKQALKETKRLRELNEIAQKTAKAAINNTLILNNDDDLDDDEEETQELQPSSATDSVTSPEDIIESDVFDVAKQWCEKKGEPVRFYIYKNNALITTANFPYSWERVQSDYGEGHYRIDAKVMTTGRFIKRESKLIGEDPNKISKPVDQNQETQAQPVQNQPSFLEIFSLMNQLSEKSESKVREARIAEAQNANTMMTSLVAMMQSQAQQQQTMMMEMSKQSASMIAEMNKTSLMIFDKLNSKIDGRKDNGIDPLALQKLLMDARKEEREALKESYEMIEKKAEEKAELILAAKEADDDDDDEEPESLSDTVIKTMLPVIAQGFQRSNTQPPQQNNASHQAQPVSRPVPKVNKPKPIEEVKKIETKAQVDDIGFNKVSNVDEKAKNFIPVNAMAEKIQSLALPTIIDHLNKNINPEHTTIEVLKILLAQSITKKDVLANFRLPDIIKTIDSFGLDDRSKKWITDFANVFQRELNSETTVCSTVSEKLITTSPNS